MLLCWQAPWLHEVSTCAAGSELYPQLQQKQQIPCRVLQQQPPWLQLTPPEAAAAKGVRHEAALHSQPPPLQQAHSREAVPVLAARCLPTDVLDPVIHDAWAPGCHTAQGVQQVLWQPAGEPLEGGHLCRCAAIQQLQAGRRKGVTSSQQLNVKEWE